MIAAGQILTSAKLLLETLCFFCKRLLEKFTSSGIETKSGEKINIDMMVTATGYKGQEYVVEELFGKSVVDKIGPIWDLMKKGKS